MTLDAFLGYLLNLLNSVLIPTLFVLAFLFALWSIYRYFFLGWNDKSKREEGKKVLVSVLIGFVLLFSVWGVVQLLIDSTGFGSSRRPDLPKLFDFRGTGSSNTQDNNFNINASERNGASDIDEIEGELRPSQQWNPNEDSSGGLGAP